MKTDKMLYAATEEDIKEAAKQFMALMKTDNLPSPMKIERYEEKQGQKIDPEKKVLELFGAENVTIE